ncbi:helix-turn-helix transcriptional regulator [Paenibacillus sp. FSL E2-0178]|uniref:helix-turn-helix domain-containing protein n=1 Tax=Paenibacillus sp. FSL E2-0178 TaxID=2921361 RepID=UPI003158AC0C
MNTLLFTREYTIEITNEQKFGTFIKNLRESKRLSLRDVADICFFSPAHLSNLERGQSTSGRTVKATPEVIKELSHV